MTENHVNEVVPGFPSTFMSHAAILSPTGAPQQITAGNNLVNVVLGHDRQPSRRGSVGASDLIDVDAVLSAYHDISPDPSNPDQMVVFGTSGHRGSSLDGAFNDAHIAATSTSMRSDSWAGFPARS
jgi:hypothetical protein